MAETSLGKLQNQVIKLEHKVVKLQDALAVAQEEKNYYKHKYEELKKEIDDKIELAVQRAVQKAVKQTKQIYEKELQKRDQRIFDLEAKLNITSDTSSLPESKDPIGYEKEKEEIPNNNPEPSGNEIGGQLGHTKSKLNKFTPEEITEIKEHTEKECTKCHSTKLEITNVKERHELDFEINITKVCHKFYEYICKECGAKIKSNIPPELHAENQYGSSLKTLGTALLDLGFVSYNRSRKFIFGLTNGEINPSEGYLAKLQKNASNKLADFVFDIKEKILKSKLVGWDDTVIKIGEKDKGCLRVYTAENFALYKAHVAKDTKGMDEDGILQNLGPETTVVHDHLLHNYCKEYQYQNAECNAHITRNAKGIEKNTKHNWPKRLCDLLRTTNHIRNERMKCNQTSFQEEEIQKIWAVYDEIVREGFQEYKKFKHKYEYEKEENLLEFLRDFKDNILCWVRNWEIPYSNNLCETLLRFTKSKMKISYQFKNLDTAQQFANIHSYTESCGRFGKNKFEALKRLFDGNPYTVAELLAEKNNQN